MNKPNYVIVLTITLLISESLSASASTPTPTATATTGSQISVYIQNDLQQIASDFGVLQNDINTALAMMQQPTGSDQPTGSAPLPVTTTPLDCTSCTLSTATDGSLSVGNCTNPNASAVTAAQSTACQSCVLPPIPAGLAVTRARSTYSCQCLDTNGNYTIPATLPAAAQTGDTINYQNGQLLDITQNSTATAQVDTAIEAQGPVPGAVAMSSLATPATMSPLKSQKQLPRIIKKKSFAPRSNRR